MELIDKDALVVEIRKRLLPVIRDKHYDEWEEGQDSERRAILSIIDTLKVKETVDAEIVEVEDNNNSIYAYTHLEICIDEDLSKICKAGDKAKVIIIKQK